MTESEARTRKERIDARLRSPVLDWIIVRNEEVRDFSSLARHAVEEYPTGTGPADYALFVDGKLLGIIEAKKVSLGAENVLEQAKRYARGVPDTVGEWRGYKVPFLYSTNGESIFHLDVRRKENASRLLADFHSPQALLEKYRKDTESAERWFAERPREKLLEQGAPFLSDQELLAVILGRGTQKDDVLALSKKIIKIIDEKGVLFSPHDITSVDGIGSAKAAAIAAAFEFVRRRIKPEGLKIKFPADILSERASSVIVAHNHPHGELKPSPEDLQVTKQLKEAAKILGLSFLDHIIFNTKVYYSFAESDEL